MSGCFWPRFAVEARVNFVSYSFSWDELPKLVCCVIVSHAFAAVEGKATWLQGTVQRCWWVCSGMSSAPFSIYSHCKQHCSNFSWTAFPSLVHYLWRKGVGYSSIVPALPGISSRTLHTFISPSFHPSIRCFSLLLQPCGLAHFPHSFDDCEWEVEPVPN